MFENLIVPLTLVVPRWVSSDGLFSMEYTRLDYQLKWKGYVGSGLFRYCTDIEAPLQILEHMAELAIKFSEY